MAKTWAEAIAQLESYATLEPDWDSYGGQAPPEETRAKALRWAAFLERMGVDPPAAIPVSGGGDIAFEWCEGSRDRQLEIDAKGIVSVFASDGENYWHSGTL